MDIIQQLKENEKAFALMVSSLTAEANSIGAKEFEFFANGKNGVLWELWLHNHFEGNYTYRLRQDYTEEPEPKCTVYPKITCDAFEKGKCPRL